MNMDFENQSLANRPIPQAPAARPIPTHGQEIPPDWRSQHPVLQAILSFAQPILLRLVERKNVRLSVTRHQDHVTKTRLPGTSHSQKTRTTNKNQKIVQPNLRS